MQITTVELDLIQTHSEMTSLLRLYLQILTLQLLLPFAGDLDDLIEKGVDLVENCLFGSVYQSQFLFDFAQFLGHFSL